MCPTLVSTHKMTSLVPYLSGTCTQRLIGSSLRAAVHVREKCMYMYVRNYSVAR